MTTKNTIKALIIAVLGLALFAISEHRTSNMIKYAQNNNCKWSTYNGYDICK